MWQFQVPDSTPAPSMAARSITVTLALALGLASQAEVEALSATNKWVAPSSLGELIDWLYGEQLGGVPAAKLGVITGDVDTNEDDNTDFINTFFSGGSGSYRTLVLGPGVTRVSDEITIPFTCRIIGWGHAGSTLKSNATAGPVVRATQLAQLINVAVDATTARKTSGAADGDGVLVSGGDESPLDSNFQQIWSQVRVYNQPRDGIHIIGQNQSSYYGYISIAENLRHGFVIEDGTHSAYTNKAQEGQCDIFHLRSNNNAGLGLMSGSIGQTNEPYRVYIHQAELNDNAWDSTKMPVLQNAVPLAGTTPIQTFIGNPVIIVTQTGGHQAIRGHYVTLAGATDTGGFLAADLNKTHQVTAWLSDTTFSITMDAGAAASATGGGGSVTATHRIGAQAFLSGSSHRISQSGFGNALYDQTATVGGTTKPAQKHPTGGVYIWTGSRIKFSECRYITVAYGWAADMYGTPSTNQATSLSDAIYDEGYLNISAQVGNYLFYIPSGCVGCEIVGDIHSGSTNLVWCREPKTFVTRAGVKSRCCDIEASPGFRWLLGDVPATHVVAVGAVVTSNDRLLVQGEGNLADDFTTLNSGAMPPAGYECLLINPNAYTITVKHNTGASQFRLTGDADKGLAQDEALRVVSRATYWQGVGSG